MERDSYFDNYKAFLIILVVVGHFLEPIARFSFTANFLRKSIYIFHMGAFIFISGYFSKKNDIIKLIKGLLLPYAVFQFIYFICNNYIWGKERPWEFLRPAFTLWFLLALFILRCLVDKLVQIKGILVISFLLSILAGFDISIDTFGALSRVIGFLPIFLLGYFFDKEKFLEVTQSLWIKIGAIATLVTIFTTIYIKCEDISFKSLEFKFSYMHQNVSDGVLVRILVYCVTLTIIYALAIIMPKNKYWFSYIGTRTMGIYLLHGLICKSLQYCTPFYHYIKGPLQYIILVMISIGLALLLSMKIFDDLVRKISNIPIEKLLQDKD